MIENRKRKLKSEKGAASTLVLFTILTFIAILMGTYMLITTMQKSQLKSDMRIQEIYKQEVDRANEIYEELSSKLNSYSSD